MRILVGLEGTLSDDGHRYNLKNESFTAYQEAVSGDSPNEKLINFLSKLDAEIFVYSTTPENLRPAVNDWLLSNNVDADEVYLKKKNDYRPEFEVKISVVEALDEGDTLVIENSPKVADELRQKGYLVFQT